MAQLILDKLTESIKPHDLRPKEAKAAYEACLCFIKAEMIHPIVSHVTSMNDLLLFIEAEEDQLMLVEDEDLTEMMCRIVSAFCVVLNQQSPTRPPLVTTTSGNTTTILFLNTQFGKVFESFYCLLAIEEMNGVPVDGYPFLVNIVLNQSPHGRQLQVLNSNGQYNRFVVPLLEEEEEEGNVNFMQPNSSFEMMTIGCLRKCT